MKYLILVLFLAACGDSSSDAPPDAAPVPDAAPGGFTWTISVGPSDAVVTIDGEETLEWVGTFADETAAYPLTIATTIEGVAADSIAITAACSEVCLKSGLADSRYDDFCTFDSGEIRPISTECEADAHCIADSFCLPKCSLAGECLDGGRCGIQRVPGALDHGWLACVEVGAVAEGDACAVGVDGVDDCAAGLGCIEGTCQLLCEGPGGCTCDVVPGMSPEVGVCAD